jgi:site-specific DNA-methyltransferase (adenine-specific)
VESIVTDQPYDLGLMGRSWDSLGIAYNVDLWCECLRVLKPGGHLLAFGGSRTYHRLACAVEDAGFEIRDQIMWIYGSGFPKSLNVGRAIPEAQKWQGWGTALKPAHEPVVVARKPLVGTVAGNVLTYGTGALNIDGCRVEFSGKADEAESKGKNRHADFGTAPGGNEVYGDYSMVERKNYDAPGRWPANLILDGSDEVVGGFPTTAPSRRGKPRSGPSGDGWGMTATGAEYNDEGSAARFFKSVAFDDDVDARSFFYCPKANKSERNAGLNEVTNSHPTVKPLALMRYLIRLITPPGGLVLDPFLGSGTTAVAATLEGFEWVGSEMTEEYWPIIEARVRWGEEQVRRTEEAS